MKPSFTSSFVASSVPTGSGSSVFLSPSTSSFTQPAPWFPCFSSRSRPSSATRIASSAVKHPAVLGRMMYLLEIQEIQQRPPLGVDQPLAAHRHRHHLARRGLQRLLHQLIAGVLAGADEQPIVNLEIADLQVLHRSIPLALGCEVLAAPARRPQPPPTKVTISMLSPSPSAVEYFSVRSSRRLSSTATFRGSSLSCSEKPLEPSSQPAVPAAVRSPKPSLRAIIGGRTAAATGPPAADAFVLRISYYVRRQHAWQANPPLAGGYRQTGRHPDHAPPVSYYAIRKNAIRNDLTHHSSDRIGWNRPPPLHPGQLRVFRIFARARGIIIRSKESTCSGYPSPSGCLF